MQGHHINTFEDFYSLVMKHVGILPAHMSEIRSAAQSSKYIIDEPLHQIFLHQLEADNQQFVRTSFIVKMMDILQEIKPELSNFPQYQSVSYLQKIIYKHLDTDIFQATRISKIKEKGNIIKEQQTGDIVQKFFLQMTIILNELFQIMKEHFGIPRSSYIDGIVYETMYQFAEKNTHFFFTKIQGDKETEENELTLIEKTKYILRGIGTKIYEMYSGEQKASIPLAEVGKVEKYGQIPALVKMELEKCRKKPLEQIIIWLTQDEKAQFLQILYQFLSFLYYEKEYFQFSTICQKIIQQVSKKTNDLYFVQASGGSFSEIRHLKYVVLLYRCLEKVYDQSSMSRLFLLYYCKQHEIATTLKNPPQILRSLQDPFENERQILKCLRGLLIKQVKGEIRMNKGEQLLHQNLVIEQEFNRINLFSFKKKYEQPPKIYFQKLTNVHTKVITFLFNGFLSEDSCNVSLWEGLMPQMQGCEVYSVIWGSRTTSQLSKYGINSALQVGVSLITKAHPIIRALSVLSAIYKNIRENPFYIALQEAQKVGEFIGQFICSNFKGYFINLIGFSLGTQVISSILAKMTEHSCQNMINKVCLVGGAADKEQIQSLIQNSEIPLRVVNFFSDNDLVLKYILKLVKPSANPIGLSPLKKFENHDITNQDCTKFIDGHSKYRQRLQVLGNLHNFNQ